MKSVHPWAVMHDSWHSQSDADIIEFDTVPLHLPTPKHASQRGGGAVVGAVGQTAGPLVQVEQVFRPVQVECTLHIPLRESKVKSEHSRFRKLRCITPQNSHRGSQEGHGQLPENVGFGGNGRAAPVGRVIESGVN